MKNEEVLNLLDEDKSNVEREIEFLEARLGVLSKRKNLYVELHRRVLETDEEKPK